MEDFYRRSEKTGEAAFCAGYYYRVVRDTVLYAWFNIFANWDPYANTGGIPVAVVSLDQDYTLKDGSVVNMGESVLESLHSNTSVKWIFLDTEEEAKEAWKPEILCSRRHYR